MGIKWYLIVVLIGISLMTNNAEYLFMCFLTICVSSLKKWLLKSFRGTLQNHLTSPGAIVTSCTSYPTGKTWNKEAASNQKNSEKVKRREEIPVHMSCQPPRILLARIHPDWCCSPRKNPESEWLARDNPATITITAKPETVPRGSTVLLGSRTLLLSARAPLFQ